MFVTLYDGYVLIILMPMEPAIALNISICAALVGLTGYAIYTAFGPPQGAWMTRLKTTKINRDRD